MTPVLRPAHPMDASHIGRILYRFQEDTSWMPKLHAEVETIAFCSRMIDRGWVTTALTDDEIVGFMACDRGEICSLYLAADHQGQGIGEQLIAAAKEAHPSGLHLAAFVANTGAMRFYRRQGFVETGRGDGSTNDEGLSDVKLRWTPAPQKTKTEAM